MPSLKPSTKPPRKPSLNSRLLRHVMLPLASTWALGTLIVIAVSQHFAGKAFDRAQLDDAYLVASRVTLSDAALTLNLSDADLNTVLFDQSERAFLAVHRADGSLLAGHPGLRPIALQGGAGDAAGGATFGEQAHLGRVLRSVTLWRSQPAPFSVTIAQTTASRDALLQRLLLTSVLPQLALLVLLTWWLRRTIRSDLQPLSDLQTAVEQRDASDLTPVGAGLTDDAKSRDMQRLSLAINALLQRLGDSIQAQREFAGNVAHELRTPLAGIRALADYGLAQSDPAAWRLQLQAIVDSQRRASHLVDQLLALALADEARSSLRLETLRLDRLVHALVLRHLPRADACGVDLGAEGLDQAVTVRANAPLVEGLLNNLIDNALRYGAAPAGSASTLTVSITREDDGVRLSVSDNGPGLEQGQREHLLRRWAQGDAGLQLGQGSGLGLAIVARYAALMAGRLDIAPGPDGAGLRVSLTLQA